MVVDAGHHADTTTTADELTGPELDDAFLAEFACAQVWISPPENAYPYRGRVGMLFTIGTTVPLLSVGLRTVDLEIDGMHVRRLALNVNLPG